MTTPAAGRPRASELALRIVSGIVMAAAALGVAWIGGPLFALFWILAGVAVGVEWAWLAAVDPKARRWTAQLVALTLGAAGALFALGALFSMDLGLTWPVLAIGTAAAAFLARPIWFAAVAVPYGAAVFLGAILLRADPADGLLAVLFLFAVVWTTDVAAYAAGRTFGGPKLAPRISPKKTWSGAIGGALGGTAAGVAVAAVGGVVTLAPVAAIAFAASIATEIGDLVESGAKRKFGAKDSGSLIPGHGGLMDRMDGFLVAATLMAVIGVARGGFAAAGQGLLRW